MKGRLVGVETSAPGPAPLDPPVAVDGQPAAGDDAVRFWIVAVMMTEVRSRLAARLGNLSAG